MVANPAYSEELKERALEIYADHGPTAAALATGASKSVVCKWAKDRGISTSVAGPVAATESSVARRHLKAAEWREEMSAYLRDVTLRAVQVEWTLLTGDTPLSLEKVSASRSKAVSDLLLITGEATQRIGLQGSAEEHAAGIAKLRDELAERRRAREA